MVDALAFPLLVCANGKQAGWIDAAELSRVAARVSEIAITRNYGRDAPRGLVGVVEARYRTTERIDEFARVVGNGTLWTALMAALEIDPSAPLHTIVRNAAALRDVYRCRALLASSEPAVVSSMLSGIIVERAEQ